MAREILRLPRLRAYQERVLASPARDLVIVAAPQTGKTAAAACWILVRAWMSPGTLSWWASPTHEMARHGYRVVVSFARSAGILSTATETPPLVCSLSNGSRIEGRSWDVPSRLAGPAVHHLVADEFATMGAEVYGALAGRRAETLGPARWLTNTDVPGSGAAEELWELAASGASGFEGLRWTWRTRAECHPCPCGLPLNLELAASHRPGCGRGAYLRYLMAERQRMSSAQWRAKFEAEWLAWSASPAYTFATSEHVRKDLRLDPALPIRLACDFNVGSQVWLVAQSHNGEAWIVDEILASGGNTTVQSCKAFLSRYDGFGAGVVIHGDASGRSRKTSASKSDYDLIRELVGARFPGRFRLDVPSFNGSVVDRVAAVNAMLEDATGKVRLWVHPRAKTLTEDLAKTSWQSTARELDKSDPRRTHASDALGYLVLRVGCWRGAGSGTRSGTVDVPAFAY